MSHLSASGIFGMVFEHLRDCFHPEDSTSGFLQLFKLCSHIVKSQIPLQIASVLCTAHLLTMTKPSGKVCPIIVGQAMYQLISRTLCFQLCDTFVTNFSPHQFGITTKGDYEKIVHGIKYILNFYRD
jgi:hypothetical protein